MCDVMFLMSFIGRLAGLNMAGKKEEINSVPYFWTVIFGKSLRYTGNFPLAVSVLNILALVTNLMHEVNTDSFFYQVMELVMTMWLSMATLKN